MTRTPYRAHQTHDTDASDAGNAVEVDVEDALASAAGTEATSSRRIEEVRSPFGAGTSLRGCLEEALAKRDRWSASRKASRLLAPKASVPESELFDMAATASALPIPLFAASNILFSAAAAAGVQVSAGVAGVVVFIVVPDCDVGRWRCCGSRASISTSST